ncbi:MAG: UpxY family transcription antiterminator [candidate division KSB1 bacterium]|nr:UpxY family transcription antiterminator [candidate division KSB1 bacterium]
MIPQRQEMWYAFVTRPRHEKKVKLELDEAGIENFLPLRKTLNQWKDRKRWVEAPLFSSYIFCHIPFVYRYEVIKVPSVARIISFKDKPTPVRDEEIYAIKMLLEQNVDVQVQNGLDIGEHVRIGSGLLMGYEGQVVEARGVYYFAIQIECIGKTVLVDIRNVKIERCA